MSGNRYVYVARHPRLAARKLSERLGRSDPATNLAEEADRHERALRDINRRLIELGGSGSPTGRAWVPLDYPKAEIRISARVAKRRTATEKEPFTVAWLERELRDEDVYYDIGANIGAYSLVAGRIGGPGTRVVAFEPAAETFSVLCENVVLNDLGGRVVPLPVVLGRETRLGTFRYSDFRAGAAQHDSSSGQEAGADFVYGQPVLTFRLDDLVGQFDLPRPTLVKLDVDGAEADVLAGAAVTLRSEQLRSLMVEMESGDEVVPALLREAGLTVSESFARADVVYGLFTRRGS